MAVYRNSVSWSHGLGTELEDELVCACDEWFRGKDLTGFVCMSNTYADKYEGTDAYIYGVPCDFTCNYEGKDNMEELDGTIDLEVGAKVRFGVRIGNNYRGRLNRFKKPVLVIAIDGVDLKTLGGWMNTIVYSFKQQLESIINLGQDQYWDWCEINGVSY